MICSCFPYQEWMLIMYPLQQCISKLRIGCFCESLPQFYDISICETYIHIYIVLCQIMFGIAFFSQFVGLGVVTARDFIFAFFVLF